MATFNFGKIQFEKSEQFNRFEKNNYVSIYFQFIF